MFIVTEYAALSPKPTNMVMAGRSVHLTTLFPGQVNQYFMHILSLVTDNKLQPFFDDSAEGRRMTT